MAKKTENINLKLAGADLCFAGQTQGITHLLLPQDPFQGYLVEEIALELAKAQKSLQDQELICKEDSGAFNLSTDLSQVVEILGNPDRSIILQQEMVSGESTVVYFHNQGKEWIDLELVEDGFYQIKILKSDKELGGRVEGRLELKTREKEKDLSTQIKYEDYSQAQVIAREKGLASCKKFLEGVGFEIEVGEKLAADLSKPFTSGSVTEWHWQDQEIRKSDGLAFLGGEERFWLVKEHSKKPDWLTITLSTSEEIQNEILKLL